jgi:hypothetical protein
VRLPERGDSGVPLRGGRTLGECSYNQHSIRN